MATKGWTPRTGGRSDAAEPAAPSPAPVRRRTSKTKAKSKTADIEAQPGETPLVDAAAAASPRISTGVRPAPGVKAEREAAGRKQISYMLGVRWSEIVLAIRKGEYTWAEFVDGLDEQELARGQLRADDGTFVGRPPSLVPREFLLACQREQKRRFEEMFGSEVLGLTKDFLALCKDNSIPPKDRAKLLQYAMERVFGGIPKDVRVSQEQPWEQMMVNVVTEEGEAMPEHLSRRYATYKERQGAGRDE